MTFDIDQALINELGAERTNRLLANINQSYDVMYGLVGGTKPNNGQKMGFKSDRTLPEGIEGRSGYPILWKTASALGHASKMAAQNVDNTETPFHEVGHNFDSYRWNFEAEALTSIKVYYYFATTDQKMAVSNQEIIFTGAQYKDYMKSYANRVEGSVNYDASIPNGVYSRYGLAYNLANIADSIGWEPFRQTYAHFNNMNSWEVPKRKIDKFNLFMTKLKDFSGKDVLSMFTANEIAVYEAELGGKIEYLEVFTKSEVIGLANYYMSQQVDAYTVYDQLLPLYDESGKVFVYAVPFWNKTTSEMGHINIGALKNGLAFYIIDPIRENYNQIQTYSLQGQVKYSPPFLYYVDKETTRSIMEETVPFTQNPQYFNEENAARNQQILELIQKPQPLSDNRSDTVIVGLSNELNGQNYNRIIGDGKTYYGGAQGWWEYSTPAFISKTGHSGSWLNARGCGVVALADNMLYQIEQNYEANKGLLKYTNLPAFIVSVDDRVPNPSYQYDQFDKTFAFSFAPGGMTMTRSEYLKYLDFYADMLEMPTLFGMNTADMQYAHNRIAEVTGYQFQSNSPTKQYAVTVENFFKEQLNQNLPIFMLNLFEHPSADTKYNKINDSTQSFNDHWMTITKFFHSLATGDRFVAISSWGRRFSVNTQLMMTYGTYYSDFFTYKVVAP